MAKVGILSGTFDPVHKGHIGLALTALKSADLDSVYLLVEAKPRHKSDVSHLAHRLAMIKLAIKPYPKLKLLDLPDKQFSVAKTLPRLKQKFPSDELYYIVGADVLEHMIDWPLLSNFLKNVRLIVANRGASKSDFDTILTKPIVIKIPNSDISSSKIRQVIGRGQASADVVPSVQKYIKANWLYSVVGSNNS